MKGNKRGTSNRYRSDESGAGILNFGFEHLLDVCIKCLLLVIVIVLISLSMILCHDLITQSELFSVRNISVSGLDRLSRQEILDQGGVHEGENLFKLNLFTIQKQLIAHPWINDASVRRVFPNALNIEVREEVPLFLAVQADVAELLVNQAGVPFLEPGDLPADLSDLPKVTGLWLEEKEGKVGFQDRLFNSVMDVLMLEKQIGQTRIHADNDLGIDILTRRFKQYGPDAGNSPVLMRLGFDYYAAKYRKTEKVVDYIHDILADKEISTIDVRDPTMVTVRMIGRTGDKDSSKGGA